MDPPAYEPALSVVSLRVASVLATSTASIVATHRRRSSDDDGWLMFADNRPLSFRLRSVTEQDRKAAKQILTLELGIEILPHLIEIADVSGDHPRERGHAIEQWRTIGACTQPSARSAMGSKI